MSAHLGDEFWPDDWHVSLAEHEDRMARVLSVPCPYCGEPAGRVCTGPGGDTQGQQHAARWDAWYAAHPETSTP